MLLKNRIAVIYGAGGANRRRGRPCFCTGRSQAFSYRESACATGSGRQGHPIGRRCGRGSGGRRSRRESRGQTPAVGDRQGGPHRYLVQRDRYSDGEIAGLSLAEMDAEMFFLPIAAYTRSYFLTARLATRRMIQNKSGVIMTVTALNSRKGIPGAGGYGPSRSAKEALTRDLSVELAPHGIRVGRESD
jgi:Enoyl-(Acyl carrier protein) reductase